MDTSLIIPAFIAGLLTFLAPCTLPLVPAYLGFISGISLDDLKDPAKARRVRGKILLNGIAFVIGWSVVFILLGTLVGFIGAALVPYRIWLSRIGGIFVVIFGLFMLNVVKIPFLAPVEALRQKFRAFVSRKILAVDPNRDPSRSLLTGLARERAIRVPPLFERGPVRELPGHAALRPRGSPWIRLPHLLFGALRSLTGRGRPVNSFILGSAFGIGWTPCVGPILGSVLLLASTTATAFSGAFLLGVFSIGLAIPFLVLALGIGSASGLVERASGFLNVVSVIGGLFLIGLGILIFTGNTAPLISYGYRWFRFINYERLLDYL